MNGDLVGHDIELGPHAFADAEVRAFEHEAAGQRGRRCELERGAQFACFAFDRQLAGGFVLVRARGFEALQHKAGLG